MNMLLLQGVFFPAYYAMAGKWAPLEDRALIDAMQGSGIQPNSTSFPQPLTNKRNNHTKIAE